MIPYQELVTALANWRTRQGLPTSTPEYAADVAPADARENAVAISDDDLELDGGVETPQPAAAGAYGRMDKPEPPRRPPATRQPELLDPFGGAGAGRQAFEDDEPLESAPAYRSDTNADAAYNASGADLGYRSSGGYGTAGEDGEGYVYDDADVLDEEVDDAFEDPTSFGAGTAYDAQGQDELGYEQPGGQDFAVSFGQDQGYAGQDQYAGQYGAQHEGNDYYAQQPYGGQPSDTQGYAYQQQPYPADYPAGQGDGQGYGYQQPYQGAYDHQGQAYQQQYPDQQQYSGEYLDELEEQDYAAQPQQPPRGRSTTGSDGTPGGRGSR